VKKFLAVLLLSLFTTVAHAEVGDHIPSLAPWEYDLAKEKANEYALKCAQLGQEIVLSVDVVSAEIKNTRFLAEKTCETASGLFKEIRTQLEQRPYDKNGPIVNPNP